MMPSIPALIRLADYLTSGVEQLVRAGAEFGFIATNTPHLVVQRWLLMSPSQHCAHHCGPCTNTRPENGGLVWNSIHHASELLPGAVPAGEYCRGPTSFLASCNVFSALASSRSRTNGVVHLTRGDVAARLALPHQPACPGCDRTCKTCLLPAPRLMPRAKHRAF